MTEDQRSESRVAGLLDSIDLASRKIELAIKEKRSKKSAESHANGNNQPDGVEPENIDERVDLSFEEEKSLEEKKTTNKKNELDGEDSNQTTEK